MGRILHLISTAGPGGAETVFLNIVDSLDRSRWESIPVVPEMDWMTERLLELGHAPILDTCRGLTDLGFWRRLARLIREESVDVIHAHLFGPTVEASLIGTLTGIPVVCTLHGKGDLSPNERFRSAKFRLINRGAARVVFVSESLRRYFLEQGPLDPAITAMIPNGIDFSRFEHDSIRTRRDLDIPEGRFIVGAVGNLRPVKRYDVLLEAAARLREQSPDYFFVIVGQAPADLHAELLALRDSLDLKEHVRFVGFQEEVEKYLSTFDLFALSSDSEGFSIATVQAMAAGLPIVATRCGGPEEILEDGRTGTLVPTGAPAAIAAAVDRLRLDPAARKALGQAARADAERRFSLAAQVASYEALYERVMRERGARRKPRPSPAAPVAGATHAPAIPRVEAAAGSEPAT